MLYGREIINLKLEYSMMMTAFRTEKSNNDRIITNDDMIGFCIFYRKSELLPSTVVF